tara:strand:+ start:316 stop:738 length:423 start_codon:yes stop_codon:yes gene_type:complete
MSVTHCGICQVKTLVRPKGGSEFLWSKFEEFCPTTGWRGLLGIKRWHNCWTSTHNWLTIFHQRITIYDGFSQKVEETSGTILPNREVEKALCFIDESCGAIPREKLWVRYKVDKERDIGFDSPHAKLLEAPFNMTSCFDV